MVVGGYFQHTGVGQQGHACRLAKRLAHQKITVAMHEIQAFVLAGGVQQSDEFAFKHMLGVVQGVVARPQLHHVAEQKHRIGRRSA